MQANKIEAITKTLYTYINPSICIFGLLCNILNLTVLSSNKLRESPFTYLKALAFSDLFTFFFTLTTSITRGKLIHKGSMDIDIELFIKKMEILFFIPTINVFSAMSVSVVLALTIERFLFMKFPFQASVICTKRNARCVIGVLFAFILLFRLPMYFFRDAQIQENFNVSSSQNTSSQRIVIVMHYEKFQKTYFASSLTIFEIIPFFAMSILNVSIIILLKASNKNFDSLFANRKSHPQLPDSNTDKKQLETMRQRKRDELKLTRQLVVLVSLVALSEVFSLITYDKITEYLIGSHFPGYMNSGYRLQVTIAHSINLIVHSFNFFVLCAFNTRYFNIFKQRYSCIFGRFSKEDRLRNEQVTNLI